MLKHEIARESIRKGLNMCSEILGVDGSPVIPLVVSIVLNDIGSCRECEYLDAVDVCRCKQSMYDTWMGDNLDWYCAEFKRRTEVNND
jgi:hypothetical protein